MFGKIKKWLGIEGVKVEIDVNPMISKKASSIQGKLQFYSMNEQEVKEVRIAFIERFTRGRRKKRKTDEYVLGEMTLREGFTVPEHEMVELDFELPFEWEKSDMDRLQDKNIVAGKLVGLAKWAKGVRSVYRVEAEAIVKGVRLHPFDQKILIPE